MDTLFPRYHHELSTPFSVCCLSISSCCWVVVGTISYIPNSIGLNSLTRQKYRPPKIIIPVSTNLVNHHNNDTGKCQLSQIVNSRLKHCNVRTKSMINWERRTINTKYSTLNQLDDKGSYVRIEAMIERNERVHPNTMSIRYWSYRKI